VIFIFLVEKCKAYKKLRDINNVPKCLVHVGIYVYGSQSKNRGLEVKDGAKLIAKFSLVG
jgi:hypothetical protein